MLKSRNATGFTLIELIVVVIVIGILATFAVPEYLRATERAKGAKAKNALRLIWDAEKMYRAQYDKYVHAGTGVCQLNLGEFVELSAVDNDPDWNYWFGTDGENGYWAEACRTKGAYKKIALSICCMDQCGIYKPNTFYIDSDEGDWPPTR